MFGRKKLFGNSVPPCCSYCQFGKLASDQKMILCPRIGVVSPYYHCKKYRYNPLKRIPRRPPVLPHFSPEDFILE